MAWDDLRGIIEGARADHEINHERERNPIDCPVHGVPLQRNEQGIYHCDMGHVVTPCL